MTEHDDLVAQITRSLAERGVHVPDIVERIGAIGDVERLRQIARSDLLLDMFALYAQAQSAYLKRTYDETFIVSATSDEALQQLTVTLGRKSQPVDGEKAEG